MGNGEWRMENGEWRMENGEWGMENGEWRMENGEWRMENGEWRMGNGEWGIGNGEWGMENLPDFCKSPFLSILEGPDILHQVSVNLPWVWLYWQQFGEHIASTRNSSSAASIEARILV